MGKRTTVRKVAPATPAQLPRSAVRRCRSRRPGYTLLELLIVLAVLAMIAALAWPSFRKQLTKSQLVDAAKQLRTHLARTRLKAIRSGEPQLFRYQPGKNVFEIGPLWPTEEDSDFASTDADTSLSNSVPSVSASTSSSETEASGAMSTESWRTQFTLPNVIQFLDPASLETTEGPVVESGPTIDLLSDEDMNQGDLGAGIGLMDESEYDAGAWSEPIVFFPNGRASNARIMLTGQRGFEIEVTLRGVTGVVRVGELYRRPESVPPDDSLTNEPMPPEDRLLEPPMQERALSTEGRP